MKNNKLSHLPKSVAKFKFIHEIWLGQNPFHCDCSMTWMIAWINNFTLSPSKQHIIIDYKNVKCYTGMMIGLPIYKLSEIEMGCFPNKWTTWQKGTVGAGVVMVLLLVVTAVLIVRKRKTFPFLMYYYVNLNTIPKDEKDENIDDKEYDAYLSFW